MRKHIDRAAVRKVIGEKRFLRRLTDKRPDGSVIPGEAFGLCGPEDLSAEGFQYLYSIVATDEGLLLQVDSYSVEHGIDPVQFDVDAWDAGKISIGTLRRDRVHFQFLHRTARMLLAGIDVRLPSGERVAGIRSGAVPHRGGM